MNSMTSMLSREDAKLVRLHADGSVSVKLKYREDAMSFGHTFSPYFCNARRLRKVLKMYRRQGILVLNINQLH